MSWTAAGLVFASAGLHVTWNHWVRHQSGRLGDVWAMVLSGGVVAAVAALVIGGTVDWARAWPYIIATGLIHTVYFRLLARVYRVRQLAEGYTASRGVGVLLTAGMAWGFGMEPWRGDQMIGIGLTVLGIGLVAGRPKRSFRSGFGTILGVGLAIAAYSLTDSLAVHWVAPDVYVALLYLGAAVGLWPAVWQEGARAIAWPAALAAGIGSVLSYALVLWAYRLGPVAPIVAIRQVAPVLATAWDGWQRRLRDPVPSRVWWGTLFVVGGAIVLVG
ncbi:MAG: hypothetical protein OWQ57_01690 [Sulfobacillus sp.]|nr:hypothetical protein [Sulfobacillus sp.]